MFFGETAESLAAGGDALTDRVAETLREWAGHARERGVAAIFEAAQLRGMGDRVLSWHDGERHMTDLAHMTQLLQDAAHRDHFTCPRCGTGCAPNAPNEAAQRNASGGWTTMPLRCRS